MATPVESNESNVLKLVCTPALMAELDRVMAVTDAKNHGDVFRRAFTLLRIHVDAAMKGSAVQIHTRGGETFDVTLPFTVKPE